MFKTFLNANQGLEWLRSLFHAGTQPQAPRPELFVPDGCLALRIQDGHPDAWLEPGRHQLGGEPVKVEVRLIPSGLLRGPQRMPLDQAMTLPYERALLFLDGRHIATKIPGTPVRRPAPILPAPSPAGRPAVEAALEDEEKEWIQDCTYV